MHPAVTAFTRIYRTGVTQTKAAMRQVEQSLRHDPVLGKWFVTVIPTPRVQAKSAPG